MLKKILLLQALFLSVFLIISCGGGGGSSSVQTENGKNIIDAESGGTVTYNSTIRLSVPANSLKEDTEIIIKPVSNDDSAGADGLKPVGQSYEFTPAGTTFQLNIPAVLEMTYDESALAKKGYSADTLQMYYYDDNAGRYFAVASTVDKDSKKVTAYVEHFTRYVIMARDKLAANNIPYVAVQNAVPNIFMLNAPFYVRATVRDYDGALSAVRLFYRKLYPTPGAWVEAIMKKEVRSENTTDTYGYVIPANFVTSANLGAGNDLEYYIVATDSSNTTRTSTTAVVNIDPTREVNFSTLAVNPSTLEISSGFERYITVTARDITNRGPFVLIPESFNLSSAAAGTVANYYSSGLRFHANGITGSLDGSTDNPVYLTVNVGTGSVSSAIKVRPGEINSVEILDSNSNTITGDIVLIKGENYDFDAVGRDEFGNSVLIYPSWSADGNMGVINSTGTLNTSTGSGNGSIYISLGNSSDSQGVRVRIVVDSTTPANAAVNVADNSTIQINFTDTVDSSTVDEDSIIVKRVDGTEEFDVDGTFSFSGNSVIFTPDNPLFSNDFYRVDVTGDVIDVHGNPVNPYTFTFRVMLKDAVYLEPMFGNPNETLSTITAGASPNEVVTGDFNNDGKKDLAVALSVSNQIKLYLGKGDGTFNYISTTNTINGATSLVVGQFNNDSNLDIAYLHPTGNLLEFAFHVLTGNGNGTFQSGVNQLFGWATSITAADFNMDGRMDLAVVGWNNSNYVLSVYRNNGNGTFMSPLSTIVTNSNISVLVKSGDFNGDGFKDVVISSMIWSDSTTNLFLLIGTGTGSFEAAKSYLGGSSISDLTVGDFNNDGIDDAAVTNSGTNSVIIMAGKSDKTLQQVITFNSGVTPAQIITSDLNDDGNLDFVVNSDKGNMLRVFNGRGNYRFDNVVNYAGCYGAMVAADFNYDDTMDVAAADYSGGSKVRILLNVSGGYLTGPLAADLTGTIHRSFAGDFDRDGMLDVAVTNYSSKNLSIYYGKGNGTYEVPAVYETGNGPMGITGTDFNKDTYLDLVTCNYSDSTVSIFYGNSSGEFDTAMNISSGNNPHSVVSGDFNNDTWPDIAVSNYTNQRISILLNSQNELFGLPGSFTVGTNPAGLICSDFNEDGTLDIAVANYNSNTVSIMSGNGLGGFSLNSTETVGANPGAMAAGDFNKDGDMDFAVTSGGANCITVFIGTGTFTFFKNPFTVGTRPVSITTGDYNGDTILDFAVANQGSSNISILTGVGDCTFNPHVTYYTGCEPGFVTSGDFTNDGRTDISVVIDDTVRMTDSYLVTLTRK